MPDLYWTQQDRPATEGVLMRPWLRTVLKVAIMAATMCSGIIVAKSNMPLKYEGHEGGRDVRQTQQDLHRAA
jgi:hypothetical protein